MRVADRVTEGTSMNASFNGAAFGLDHLEGYSITVACTETSATLAGTLKLQVSNNAFADNVNNDADSAAVWVDLTSSSQSVSGTGNFVWNVSDAYYRAVRVVWTRTSGQGTCSTYIHAKGPNS